MHAGRSVSPVCEASAPGEKHWRCSIHAGRVKNCVLTELLSDIVMGMAPAARHRDSARLSWSYTLVLLCTQGRETTISMAKGLVQMVFVGMVLRLFHEVFWWA